MVGESTIEGTPYIEATSEPWNFIDASTSRPPSAAVSSSMLSEWITSKGWNGNRSVALRSAAPVRPLDSTRTLIA